MIKKKLVQLLLPLLKDVIILLIEEIKEWLEKEFNNEEEENNDSI